MANRQPTDDPLLMEGFGDRLRWLREAYAERDGAREHTKARWARWLKVSPAMYGRWESGKHLPKFVDLLRISALFRVDPNYLIAGVLSASLRPWLSRALLSSKPELLAEADYWRGRTEAYQQVSQELAAEERTNTAARQPPGKNSAKRKTLKPRK